MVYTTQFPPPPQKVNSSNWDKGRPSLKASPRPATFYEGARTTFPGNQKFGTKRQRLYHTQHFHPRGGGEQQPILPFARFPLIHPPPPQLIRRPPSRNPSRDQWQAKEMGLTASNLPERLSNSTQNRSSRPASPLTNGNQLKDSISNNGLKFRKRSGVHLPRFRYSGPDTVYQGPNAPAQNSNQTIEGPDPLQWLDTPFSRGSEQFTNSLSKKGFISISSPRSLDNPPVSHFKSHIPVQPSRSITNLQMPPAPCVPAQQMPPALCPMAQPIPYQTASPVVLYSYPNCTSPGASGNPSNVPSKLFQYSMFSPSALPQAPNLNQSGGRQAFGTGVPNEIQDDLLRIEMLLELRRYKRALNTQLQAQHRLMQMCATESNQNLPNPSQSNPSQSLRNLLTSNQLQGGRSETRKQLMDIFKLLNETGEDKGGGEAGENGQAEPKNEEGEKTTTVWERDLEKHLKSSDFNSIMEPHILGGGEDEGTGKTVNLLRGAMNTGDFAIGDRSRSGFPSGMQIDEPKSQKNLNPLIAGMNASYHGSSEKPVGPQLVPTTPALHRQYQQYHALDDPHQFPETLYTLSPEAIKILEARLSNGRPLPTQINSGSALKQGGQDEGTKNIFEMMRKPVQVRNPNSPMNAYSPVPSTSPIEKPESGIPPEEKPSPFFPGFTGDIEMKIKTPEEKESEGTEALHPIDKEKEKEKETRRGSGTRMGDVEELGNLLSQLPVLSRKQKVEEFAFQTVKPASPMSQIESETSMIPLVSSQGTLQTGTSRAASSSGRPDTTDGVVTETEDELKRVDTTKMSISELVMLGRKIYRILSQLNTTAPSRNPVQVVATPVTLEMPPTESPFNVSILPAAKKEGKAPAQASSVLIDFNSIPNPTFVTGPGIVQSRSQPKVVNSRRTPVKTPNLFKKIVHPPPTRWGRGVSMNPSTMSNNGRRSISSLPPTRPMSRSGQNIKIGVEETNYLPGGRHAPNFPVLNKFSHNHRADGMKEPPQSNVNVRKRQDTSVSYGQVDTQASTTTNATWGRSRSLNKRNFIRENISRVQNMKIRRPESNRVKPKPLPPVKRRYDNVQSTIQSRSRSGERSMSAPRDARSSSMPVTPGRTASGTVPGTAQSSRRSSIVSVASTRSRSPPNVGNRLGVRYTKTRIIPKIEKMIPVASSGKFGKSASFTKKVYGRPSDKNLNGGAYAKVILARKSRSKTRRGSGPNLRSSSASSVESLRANVRRLKSKQGDMKQKRQRSRGKDVLNTDSEQALIRNMVKAEMDTLMQRHVKELLKKQMEEEEEQKKIQEKPVSPVQSRTPKPKVLFPHESDSSTVIVSANLTPIYTPPRVYDESLFSLEKWINPELHSVPGTPYTSAKDTPNATAPPVDYSSLGAGTGQINNNNPGRKQSKSQSVRFSLPQQTQPK